MICHVPPYKGNSNDIHEMCNTSSGSIEDFYECFENSTFKHEEIISKVVLKDYVSGVAKNISLDWKSQTFSPWMGKCFSTQFQLADYNKKIKVFLASLKLKVFIFDPNFFIGSLNPSGVKPVDWSQENVISQQEETTLC